jgi:hypothetical protein
VSDRAGGAGGAGEARPPTQPTAALASLHDLAGAMTPVYAIAIASWLNAAPAIYAADATGRMAPSSPDKAGIDDAATPLPSPAPFASAPPPPPDPGGERNETAMDRLMMSLSVDALATLVSLLRAGSYNPSAMQQAALCARAHADANRAGLTADARAAATAAATALAVPAP